MPIFINCVQGEQGWYDARAGHGTGSNFWKIMAGKGARDDYLDELVAERLAGAGRDSGGMAKDWGKDAETLARQAYQIRNGVLVKQVGFAIHDRIKWVGVSSDGLVGEDGCIEIKSPFSGKVHARTLRCGMPEAHYWQVQGNLWVLERQWLDFCSYDPQFPAPLDLYVQRFQRAESSIKHLEKEVKAFLAEVNVATRDLIASNK
jgi:hypothetical protein